MKKLILGIAILTSVSTLVSCGNGGSSATTKINKANVISAEERDKQISAGAPEISFDKVEHDFGTVDEGFVVETSFKVTNSGKSDLVITNAKASCGCTVPTWPREAIKPGESSEIQVRFNTSGKPNKQSKTITLSTNTEKGQELLKISGMVIPKSKTKA